MAKLKAVTVPSDADFHHGLLGLPGQDKAIVSLLGSKPGGPSEFSFYSFHGDFDGPSERSGRPSFQDWLDRHFEPGQVIVREHPTCDFKGIRASTLEAIAASIQELVAQGRSVVVVDSGGQTRTHEVCKRIGAVEDSSVE